MTCKHEGCDKPAETGQDECFRHRIMGVGFSFRGGGGMSRHAFHERTTNEWKMDHFGTTSDRELAKQGIERRK